MLHLIEPLDAGGKLGAAPPTWRRLDICGFRPGNRDISRIRNGKSPRALKVGSVTSGGLSATPPPLRKRSPDDHRLRQSLPADVRGVAHYAGEIRLHGVRAQFQGVWPPHGPTTGAVCVRPCPLRAEQAGRVVAAPRDPDRTDHTRGTRNRTAGMSACIWDISTMRRVG